MHILFVSHYYPPEVNAPASRTHEHARCWVREGHEVTIVTGVPNHPRGELFPGYRNRLFQQERMDGVRVIRTWMYLTANEGFLRRTLNYVLFACTAVVASLFVRRPDVVVATSPQFFCGLAGSLIAKLKRRPFVLEVRDLWPDSIVQLGQLESPTAIRLLERLETVLYRSAAAIVPVTRAFEQHIAHRGVALERIRVVYNGIDTELFHPRRPDPAFLSRHGLEDHFVVSYIGTLGLAHGLDTLLEAAASLAADRQVCFLLIGDGADRARLEAEARRRELSSVRFLGLRPRQEIPDWIACSDLLLVMLRDLAVFETVIPSKIFEFLAQERPVVLAARGEIRRLVAGAGAASCIDPEDSEQLVEAIRAIRSDPARAEGRARAGREWVEADFRRDDLARRMLGFLVEAGSRAS